MNQNCDIIKEYLVKHFEINPPSLHPPPPHPKNEDNIFHLVFLKFGMRVKITKILPMGKENTHASLMQLRQATLCVFYINVVFPFTGMRFSFLLIYRPIKTIHKKNMKRQPNCFNIFSDNFFCIYFGDKIGHGRKRTVFRYMYNIEVSVF